MKTGRMPSVIRLQHFQNQERFLELLAKLEGSVQREIPLAAAESRHAIEYEITLGIRFSIVQTGNSDGGDHNCIAAEDRGSLAVIRLGGGLVLKTMISFENFLLPRHFKGLS